MEYRRFGKTEKDVSVITLGGMRYIRAGGEPRHILPSESIGECADCVRLALDRGINLFESAHGYGKSEHLYGKVLTEILAVPRSRYFLMTKGAPKTRDDTLKMVEEQRRALKTEHIDFYAWHGINTPDLLSISCGPGGPVEALLQLKAEGVIGHVGFSTHGPREVIEGALNTDLFDFMNLHFYYFFQRHARAVALAGEKDMGVFIISPNDKGGLLYKPSDLLRTLTAPLTPIQWNARFCLSHPQVHTLSFGMTAPAHFDEMEGIFPAPAPFSWKDEDILKRMDRQKNADACSGYDGYDLKPDASGINIPEVLRMRMMWRCYDQEAFVRYRYNMFEEFGHWFPGHFATKSRVKKIDVQGVPDYVPLQSLVYEVHRKFYRRGTLLRRRVTAAAKKLGVYRFVAPVFRRLAFLRRSA